MGYENIVSSFGDTQKNISESSQQDSRNILIEIETIKEHLKRYAAKLTKDTIIIDQEDLYQDTLEKARKNQHSFKKGTNLKARMLTIMKNNFINACRKQKKKIVDYKDLDSFTNQPGRMTDIESNLYYEDVCKVVDNLSQDHYNAFLLYYKGYTHQEIADALQIPVGTAKSRIFFARKELKEALSSHPHHID